MDREPGATRWIGGPWDDPAAHAAFLRARIAMRYPPGMGYWVLSPCDAPRRFLGWVMLIPEDAVGPSVEIGWRLTGAARGKGYAREAGLALLHHAFGSLRLLEVTAEIHRANLPSLRVAEAIGMRLAAREPSATSDAFLYVANASSLSRGGAAVL